MQVRRNHGEYGCKAQFKRRISDVPNLIPILAD